MQRLLPLSTRLRRTAGRMPALPPPEQFAPGSRFDHPRAISLTDEFLRVRAFAEEASIDLQTRWLQGGEQHHPPTLAWCLRDALLYDGALAAPAMLARFRPRSSWSPVPLARLQAVASGQLCTSATAERYFGHWVHESLPLELLAADRGEQALALGRPPWLHEPGYRDLVGLEPLAVTSAVVGRLWVVDDRGLNDGRIARLRRLRERVLGQVAAGPARRVFMVRGDSGAPRRLVDEAALAETLAARGFQVLAPERCTPRELVSALRDAEVVVHVEGSAQDHLVLACAPGSARLCIQPPRRFNAYPKVYADVLGQHFGYVVADEADGGFALPAERLLRTLDLLEPKLGSLP